MQQLTQLFNDKFKFQLSQQLRHKGDSKGRHFDADCGLLVLARVVEESIQSGTLEPIYELTYHCRSIQFSGSNQIHKFYEHELMSMEEFNEQRIRDENWREEMKADMRRAEKEIMELFEVTKDDYLYLKKDGVVDKSKKYRVTGWGTGGFQHDGPHLQLTESILTANKDPESDKIQRERPTVKSKDDFEKAQ